MSTQSPSNFTDSDVAGEMGNLYDKSVIDPAEKASNMPKIYRQCSSWHKYLAQDD